MGVLYRALDTRLERIVAIKVLRPDALADGGHRRRLLQEGKAASALNHPGIVIVHDVGGAARASAGGTGVSSTRSGPGTREGAQRPRPCWTARCDEGASRRRSYACSMRVPSTFRN